MIGSFGDIKLDCNTQVNMRYPSGRFAQLTCTISAQVCNTMILMGTKGRISLPNCFWNGKLASLYQDDYSQENIALPHKINGFEYQIEEAMKIIHKKQTCSQFMSHENSLAVVQTLDEVRRQIGLEFSPDAERV
ncbi:MAG: hypothetical protein ACI9C4_001491 [Paraglaciecola sp.]